LFIKNQGNDVGTIFHVYIWSGEMDFG